MSSTTVKTRSLMKKIKKLLKLLIDNKTDMLKTGDIKKMLLSIVLSLLLVAFLTVGIGLVFFKIFALGFEINAELIAIVLTVLQGIALVFGVGSVISNLYLKKDNELLMCLPVTPNQLFISKMILVYLNEVFFNFIISVPILIGLGFYGEFGFVYYLSIPILTLLMPVIPLFLASILSIPTMAVLRFFKKHAYLSVCAMLVLVVAVLWVYIGIVGDVAETFNIANQQIQTILNINKRIAEIGKVIPLYFQIGEASLSFGKWYMYAILLGISTLLAALTVLIMRPAFFKIAMTSLETDTKTQGKRRLVKRSAFKSLVIKEFLTVFRSPGHIFEYFLFAILMPFITFAYDKLLGTATVNQVGQNMIVGAHLMVVAILAMLSNVVSASIVSREGGNFYISKIVPIDYFTQIGAKFVFNTMLTVSAIAVTSIISCFTYPVWQILLGSLAVIFASIGHTALGMNIDIKSPVVNFGGSEDTDAFKKNTVISTVIGLLIGFAMGMFIMMLSSSSSPLISYLLLLGAALVFAVRQVYVLILRIELCYGKIEI